MTIYKQYKIEIPVESRSTDCDLTVDRVRDQAEKLEKFFYYGTGIKMDDLESCNVPACCGWSFCMTAVTDDIEKAYKFNNKVRAFISQNCKDLYIM
ncbi:hypothetical protein VPHF99_0142 [Vibrio phage F99]